MKTYGTIRFEDNMWILDKLEIHICLKLKAIFSQIPKHQINPFRFKNTDDNCHELFWFMQRYPLQISESDYNLPALKRETKIKTLNELDAISKISQGVDRLSLNPVEFKLQPRDYQSQYVAIYDRVKSCLNCDVLGLGKTAESLFCLTKDRLPAVIVVKTHLPTQWGEEVAKFTNLRFHKIKKTSVYPLPEADVYIFRYSQLAGWVDLFATGFFKLVIFDEVQELRHIDTAKYEAAKVLCNSMEYRQGLSATPIYNYGIEAYNILDLLKPGCLGDRTDFVREWCGYGGRVADPNAFGQFLQSNYLMIRRTREDVGRELPPINRLVYNVETDQSEIDKIEDLAYDLAMKVTRGTFMERGQAARDLDVMVRQQTGIAKAKSAVEYIKMFLESDQPVVVCAWHRAVWDILREGLKEYHPAMYTGTESTREKDESKRRFIAGDTNLLFLSLRSGDGIDGLQKRCSTIIHVELDWSNAVHNQLDGRLNRYDLISQVTSIFLVSQEGSDPVVMDILGIKASQQKGILDPFSSVEEKHTDDTHIKLLAQKYIEKRRLKNGMG